MDRYLPEKIKICLPGKKGKVLAVTLDGDVVCETKKGDISDDEWVFKDLNLSTGEKGYHIISANYRFAMDYDQKTGEQVSTLPYKGRDHTVWHINNNEIYTIDRDGEKKYLWSILGKLYVTHDEYLAEGWQLVNLKGKNVKIEEEKKVDIIIPLLLLLILIMIIWVIYVRNK